MDIIDLVTCRAMRGGGYGTVFPPEKRTSIYRVLQAAGFAFVKLKHKGMFIHRQGNEIRVAGFSEMKGYFREYLKTLDYSLLPLDNGWHDVMNAFYEQFPLKESNQLKASLASELNAEEIHELLLQTDFGYKKTQRLRESLLKFSESGFKVAGDKISTWHRDGKQLFYRHIGGNKYLVFDDIDWPEFNVRMFDCLLVVFKKESDIGKKRPVSELSIMNDFRWERDYDLIRPYMN